jgi:hypothetical protein
MGKKGGSKAPAPVAQPTDKFAEESAAIARQLFKETTPLREKGISQLQGQLGSQNIADSSNLQNQLQQFVPQGTNLNQNDFQLSQLGQLQAPQIGQINQLGNLDLQRVLGRADQLEVDQNFNQNFGSLKAAQEAQFNNARQNVMQSGGSGGALQGSLGQLQGDRALGLSQMLADLAGRQSDARGTAINQALGVGTEDMMRGERGIERQLGVDQLDIERQLGIDQTNLANAQQIQAANQATNLGIAGSNMDRGIGLAGAQADINQRNIDRALAVGSGGAINALQGFGIGGNLAASSAATQASLANAQANRDSSGKGAKGSALGTIAGAAITKCWVAREVYGIENPQWKTFFLWKETCSPDWFRNLYNNYGEWFAKWIHNKPMIKNIIRHYMNKVTGEA